MFSAQEIAVSAALFLFLSVGCHAQSPPKAATSDPCRVEARPPPSIAPQPRITVSWADFFPEGFPPPSQRPPIDLGTLVVDGDLNISTGGSSPEPLLRVVSARIAPKIAAHLSPTVRRAWDRRNAAREQTVKLATADHSSLKGCLDHARESYETTKEALSKALRAQAATEPADAILLAYVTEPFVATEDDFEPNPELVSLLPALDQTVAATDPHTNLGWWARYTRIRARFDVLGREAAIADLRALLAETTPEVDERPATALAEGQFMLGEMEDDLATKARLFAFSASTATEPGQRVQGNIMWMVIAWEHEDWPGVMSAVTALLKDDIRPFEVESAVAFAIADALMHIPITRNDIVTLSPTQLRAISFALADVADEHKAPDVASCALKLASERAPSTSNDTAIRKRMTRLARQKTTQGRRLTARARAWLDACSPMATSARIQVSVAANGSAVTTDAKSDDEHELSSCLDREARVYFRNAPAISVTLKISE